MTTGPVHVDLWLVPWTLFGGTAGTAVVLQAGDRDLVLARDCAPILVTTMAGGPLIDGKVGVCEDLGRVDGTRRAYALPLPLRRGKGFVIETPLGRTTVRFDHVPDAPKADATPDSGVPPTDGDLLMDRVKRVWTRLREVEEVIADPAVMWHRLAERWLDGLSDERPKMDEIVKQARTLPSVVDRLDKAPRRILRRVHKQVALSRVQELDRRSMTWLTRRPGETIEQQAGDRQAIMAVAREENYDTLENRVLLAYARLARSIAADYAPATLKRALRSRERLVRSFGKRCKHLAADLVARGISEARRDVTPNFVLLNNPDYHAIWVAWRELWKRNGIFDDLWRWQARSWDEFCALAVMVALQQIEGAEPVATSPIVFRNEQIRGCWVQSVNPLGVLHLGRHDLIVEVIYGRHQHDYTPWCAPVYLRVGRVGDAQAFLKSILVWPIWSVAGGLALGEVDDLSELIAAPTRLRQTSASTVAGGVVIRPAAADLSEVDRSDAAAAVALGASGRALSDGIGHLTAILEDLLVRGVRAS